MISIRKFLMYAGVAAVLAPAAFAQTTGTLTVTGTTPEAFSLTNASEGTLSSTIALGTLTPGTGVTSTALVAGTPVDVRLRSNKLYKVTATAGTLSVTGAGQDNGGNAISLSDIGFGISSLSLAGTNVANSGSRTDAIATGFDVSGGWPAPTNGLTPAFSKTLNDITGGVQVLSGARISKAGNISTDNNYITARFNVATLPQFFTPNGGFSAVVTLTIASQ